MDYQTFYASVIDTREDDLAKGIHLYYCGSKKFKAGNSNVSTALSLCHCLSFVALIEIIAQWRSQENFSTVHDGADFPLPGWAQYELLRDELFTITFMGLDKGMPCLKTLQ